MNELPNIQFDLTSLREAYRRGIVTPGQIAEEALRRANNPNFPNVWIEKISHERLMQMARALPPQSDDKLSFTRSTCTPVRAQLTDP